MGRIEKTVFISYRRTNTPWALAIYQHLTSQGYDVFFDYLSIPSGDFEKIIIENIKGRAHFIVILTPSALERCHEPGDWLRREIETAMDEKRNIVPLMLESFDYGSPATTKALTGKLESLKKYNSLRIPSEYFFEAMARLREQFLGVALDAVAQPISDNAKQIAEEHQVAANEAEQVEQKDLTAQEWFERGYVFQENKSLDEAIRCYTEAIRLEPDATYAYSNRAGALKDKGDLEGALKDMEEAIHLESDVPILYFNRALLRLNKGDWEDAIKDYDEVISLEPNNFGAYANRGVARNNMGDLEGALQDIEEAVRIKPDYAYAYFTRGNIYRDKGDLDEAIKDYNKAILLQPDYAQAYSYRGSARSDSGDLNGSIKDYNKAIHLEPDDSFTYYNRAIAWEEKGEYKLAIVDYQK